MLEQELFNYSLKEDINEIAFRTGAGILTIWNIWNTFPKATKEDVIEIINYCRINAPDNNVKKLYKHLK